MIYNEKSNDDVWKMWKDTMIYIMIIEIMIIIYLKDKMRKIMNKITMVIYLGKIKQ